MSITKETRVTLRKTLVDERGHTTELYRFIVGDTDEVGVEGSGIGNLQVRAQDVPALIVGLQELLGAA